MNDEQARIKEINDIFVIINNAQSNLMRLATSDNQKTQFAEQLKTYQSVLINEVNKLPLQYDHPLRAAHALAKLNAINSFTEQSQFHTALGEFNHEAAHPNFSPLARQVANGIMIGIFVALLVLVLVLVTTAWFGFGVLVTSHISAAAFGQIEVSCVATGGAAGLIAGVVDAVYSETSNSVKQAKQQGSKVEKMINGFFKTSLTVEAVNETDRLICSTINP
jgi:hypothetical protein